MKFAFESTSGNHGPLVAAIAKSVCCQTYVELGIYQGEVIDVISEFVPVTIGVDISDKRINRDKSKFFLGTTADFFRSLDPGFRADIFFVDACHECSTVYTDVIRSTHFLSKHGIIIVHDTDPSEKSMTDPGYCDNAYLVIDEILSHHGDDWNVLTLPVGVPGLTLITRKSDRRVDLWR